jgi:hypothetical protein
MSKKHIKCHLLYIYITYNGRRGLQSTVSNGGVHFACFKCFKMSFISSVPDYPLPRSNLGCFYFASGTFQKAYEIFLKMLFNSPNKELQNEPKLVYEIFNGKKLYIKNAQNRPLPPRLTIFINCNICCLSNKRRIFFGFLYFARKF